MIVYCRKNKQPVQPSESFTETVRKKVISTGGDAKIVLSEILADYVFLCSIFPGEPNTFRFTSTLVIYLKFKDYQEPCLYRCNGTQNNRKKLLGFYEKTIGTIFSPHECDILIAKTDKNEEEFEEDFKKWIQITS